MDTVAIIGCGYVGLLTGSVLAYKNAQKKFIFLDTDYSKIDKLSKGVSYITEPLFNGIFDMLKNKKLTTDYNDIKTAGIIIITVNTPDNDGHCDLTYLYSTIDSINSIARQNAIIIIKSTVEVGTSKYLAEHKFREDLIIVNIPEFLAEGEAIKNLIEPNRLLIGYAKERDNDVSSILKGLFYYVHSDKIIETDSNTSELAKLSSNFLLAQRIASINAIEDLAKEKKAKITDIVKILKMDPRIGNLYLSPSAGYGGSCFRKDINNISNICSDMVFKEYLMSVNRVNDYHMSKIANGIKKDSTVLFLGYCFKENSNDIRESPTQYIIDCLHKSIKYRIYDKHIEMYSKKPDEKYDYVVLMLNEQEYIDIASEYSKEQIIDPRYILQK